jgi:hypothetical protein
MLCLPVGITLDIAQPVIVNKKNLETCAFGKKVEESFLKVNERQRMRDTIAQCIYKSNVDQAGSWIERLFGNLIVGNKKKTKRKITDLRGQGAIY